MRSATGIVRYPVLLLLACGCSSAPPASADAPGGPPVALEAWLTETLWAAELDRAALIDTLGEPRRAEAHAQPNRHDPTVLDSMVVLTYDDARFVYYIVTAGARDLLDLAEVRGNRHLRSMPPGIGTPADSLRAWWGEPVAATDSTLDYDCLSCEVPHPATFAVRDGVVREIRFDLYVD